MPSRARATKPAARKAKTAKKPAARKKTKAEGKTGPKLVVKQIRSGIGHARTYRLTLEALGLKHHQDEIVVNDHPSIRGMLSKVHHLVSVRPQEA